MSKSTPPAPDYNAAAQTQAQSSAQNIEQQTVANRPNINTPFGSQTWQMKPEVDPTTGQYVSTWTQNTTLAPQTQAALTAQQNIQNQKSQTAESLLGNFENAEATPINWNSFTPFANTPGQTTTAGNPTAQQYDKSAADAAFNSFMGYNQPLMQQAKDQLDTQLQNQGLKPGDQAYDTAMANLQRQQSAQVQQAGYGATLTGSQIGQQQAATNLAQQNQAFGQSMTGAQYQDTLRAQEAAEAMQRQGFSLNQINGILNGQQVGLPSTPGFATSGAAQPVQALNAAENTGQSQLNAFNAQQQQTASTEEGLGSLAGIAALAFF